MAEKRANYSDPARAKRLKPLPYKKRLLQNEAVSERDAAHSLASMSTQPLYEAYQHNSQILARELPANATVGFVSAAAAIRAFKEERKRQLAKKRRQLASTRSYALVKQRSSDWDGLWYHAEHARNGTEFPWPINGKLPFEPLEHGWMPTLAQADVVPQRAPNGSPAKCSAQDAWFAPLDRIEPVKQTYQEVAYQFAARNKKYTAKPNEYAALPAHRLFYDPSDAGWCTLVNGKAVRDQVKAASPRCSGKHPLYLVPLTVAVVKFCYYTRRLRKGKRGPKWEMFYCGDVEGRAQRWNCYDRHGKYDVPLTQVVRLDELINIRYQSTLPKPAYFAPSDPGSWLKEPPRKERRLKQEH